MIWAFFLKLIFKVSVDVCLRERGMGGEGGCSKQAGLRSHGDGCEGLLESNLQEVVAAG